MKKSTILAKLFHLQWGLFLLLFLGKGNESQCQTIDITQPQVGGVTSPAGIVVAGITTGSPWLTNSQIPNKPNTTSIQRIIGTNLTEATYTSADPQHYNFLTSLAVVANEMRYFHLMDKDYLAGLTPTSLPDACTSNIAAFTGGVNCDGGGYTSMLNAFTNFKSIAAVTLQKDLHVNHSIIKSFPDSWYSIEQWGGSFNNSTPGMMTVSNVQQNARNYAKAFANTYCPNATNCIVKVLEIGNEPWGEPGWAGYREVFKGYCLGLQDIYGTNISSWPMRISVGAMQFFQNETIPLNKTQRLNLTSANQNKYGSDYAGYMIPSGYEQYISSLNTHMYSVNNISYTIPTSTTTYYKEDDFSYIEKEPEASSSSFQKIKNMVLWKNNTTFPNLSELNVTEFGWNSEDVAASIYFPPSASNNQCNCNSPLKSITLVNNIRTISNAQNSDISTNTSGTDWLYFVKNRTIPFESRGVGQKAQATYLIRAYLLMARWGINKGFIYQSGDALTDAAYHHTGLISQKIPTNTNIYQATNLNNAIFDVSKKSFYALGKLRSYLGNGSAIAPVATQNEKYFLYAIKEDAQAYIYVFGKKQTNGTLTPTEIVAWSPVNINDGEKFNTPLYAGVDAYGNAGNFCTRQISSNSEYIDFTSNHITNQLTANLAVNLNIDATHNFGGLQPDNSRSAALLDWNYAGSGYTGSWQDATPNKPISQFVSGISNNNINFTNLTAIPVVIPITAPSGCLVNADGTTSGCGITASCPITFNSFTESATTALTSCPSNGISYVLKFTANSTQSNLTVPITNLPANGANSQISSPSGALNYATQTSFNWVIPTVTAGTVYTATMNYCFATPTLATGTYSTCSILSGAGCTSAPSVPTISASSGTVLCNGTGVSLTTSCSTASSIQWFNGTTPLSSSTSPLAVTAVGTYTAKCTNSCGTSGASNAITITNNSVAAPNLTAIPTTINSGQSSTLSTTNCSGTSTFYNTGTNAVVSASVSPTSTTSYSATCTVNGCQSAASTPPVAVTVIPSGCSTSALSFTSFFRNADAVSTTQSPTIDPVNCKDYVLTIKANSNVSTATTIAITNLPSNGFSGSSFSSVGQQLNYLTQQSFNWVIPSMVNTQSYSVTIKYCYATTWTTATATFSPCSISTTNNASNARLATGTEVLSAEPTENNFIVYPNPTDNKLTASFYLKNSSEVSFSIVDMQGKIVDNYTYRGETGNHTFVMDVSKLNDATYVLKSNIENKIQNLKFIIVK